MQASSGQASDGVRVAVLGGMDLEVLGQLLRALPARCGIALVVACDGRDGRDIAGVLRPGCALPVEEVRGTARLERDRVYVLPADADVAVERVPPALREVPGGRWSLDRLLRSLAEQLGRDVAAIVIGGGVEAEDGIERIKELGGLTIAVATADADGAAMAGRAVDLVLSPVAIAVRLIGLGRHQAAVPALPEDDDASGPDPVSGVLLDILAMLQLRWGHDFAAYKRAVLLRSIERRIRICEADDLPAYRRYLGEHPGELAHLRRDLLVMVTSFFRDREAFDALTRRVIPALFEGKAPDDELRVWVAGCATGEEAYSLAILLAEHEWRIRPSPRLRVFATDVDGDALARARAAVYPDTIRLDLTPERLARHFVRTGERYRLRDELCEMVVFSHHDVLRDPPFPQLDLVSCRNLLIYLTRSARHHVLDAFHAGLRPGGFLFLGPCESADNPALRFEARDARSRIYVRRAARLAPPPDAATEGGRPAIGGDMLQRLWRAVRAARMAVIGLDAEQRVAWGHVPGADAPSHLLDALAPGQASRLLELAHEATAAGQPVQGDLELVLEDRLRIYDVRVDPTGDGTVAIGFDVTQARLVQRALLEAARRKDEFFATLSHELRHPLAPLRVALDVIRHAEHSAEDHARSLAIMERQIATLARLVDDLFDLSLIAHGKLKLDLAPIDLSEVVGAALDAASPFLDERMHRLATRLPAGPVRVVGDFHRLVQVVTNLLSNAAKYTPPGGRVDLELEADPQRRMAAIRVRDTGIGLTKELMARMFELFVQGPDDRGRAGTGLGVGLNVVRRIVELHGGTVAAASAGAGQGSELMIELPLAEE